MRDEEFPIKVEPSEPLSVTAKALIKAGNVVFLDTIEKQKAEERLSVMSENLERSKREMARLLEAAGLPSFKHPNGKTFARKQSTSVRMPSDPTRRKSLFDYLRGQNLFDDFATIHWKRLSSWWAAERKVKEDAGDYSFEVPGITADEIVETTYLEVR